MHPKKEVIAVVAHMDDEILGMLSLLPRIDKVIYVTDSATQWAGPIGPVEHYAALRKRGAEAAAKMFDFTPVFMDWPNDYLTQLPAEPKAGLCAQLTKLLENASAVVTHSPFDEHIEHTFVSSYAQFIAAQLDVPVIMALMNTEWAESLVATSISMTVALSEGRKKEVMQQCYETEMRLLDHVKYTPNMLSECFIGRLDVISSMLLP